MVVVGPGRVVAVDGPLRAGPGREDWEGREGREGGVGGRPSGPRPPPGSALADNIPTPIKAHKFSQHDSRENGN